MYFAQNAVDCLTAISELHFFLGQDLGVFGYYKELIGFRRSGEPCQLMKCIEPREVRIKVMKVFGDRAQFNPMLEKEGQFTSPISSTDAGTAGGATKVKGESVSLSSYAAAVPMGILGSVQEG